MAAWRPTAVLLLCTLAVVAVYGQTLGHGFAFDDAADILDNAQIRSLGNIRTILSSTAMRGSGIESHLYRPLTVVSYAVNYSIHGLSPSGYHLVNVTLHLLAALLVFALARGAALPVGGAGLAALLFAVHPLHVEAVANIAGRKDLLAAAFVLICVLCFRQACTRGPAWIGAAAIACGAACLSKETGVLALPLALVYAHLVPDPGRGMRRLAATLSLALVVAAYLAVRYGVVGVWAPPVISPLDNPVASAPAAVRIPTALAVAGLSLRLFALPLHLSPDYSYAAIEPAMSALEPRVGLGLLMVASLALVGARTRNRALKLGAVWWLVAVVPTSNLVFPIGTIYGERLSYLPDVGLSVALAAWAGPWLLRRREGRALAAAVLVALGARAAAYTATWKDDATLFTAALRVKPTSARVQYNAGAIHSARDEWTLAVERYREAVRIYPRYGQAWNNLGNALRRLGRPTQALDALGQAAAVAPRDPFVFNNRGRLLLEEGRLAEALADLEHALSLRPDYPEALANRGVIRQRRGDLEGALRDYEAALRAAGPRWPARAALQAEIERLNAGR